MRAGSGNRGGRALLVRKLVLGGLGLLLLVTSGASFYRHRHLQEAVVLSPGVAEVKKLSEYFDGIRGTINDCNLYFFEGEEPGATVLVMGGTHPEEPAARLAAWLFAENAVMEHGRLIVVLSSNRSGTTVTRLGGAYPANFTIPTDWGQQTFRMGDRWSNPLDQWPDPEVYIHYPSGQYLAYVDIRNLNRTWPGRPDGTLTERTTYAFMELIRQEDVDIFIDLHEAELQYPVISTIVAHDRGEELATFVSMMLSDEEFNIGMEYSPQNLHGLSHREVGDYSDAISLLFEAPEPFLDATRGKTTREQLLTGVDEFVMKAGEHGLLFERIDEGGWPIDVRVGRHTSTVLQTMESWTILNPDRPLSCRGVPRYAEVIERGLGHWLHDPSKAAPGRVVTE
ncbi:MAG: succinylglutamate desuccinylase/aspartoacylase family protein [Gemmatimonadota bacterium]|nr:MAG: succinylglutamate desuccinylase/aspartoacylase family protein [Gemmatimonadota bacterium]